MQRRKEQHDSLEDLISVSKELAALIEDNNQNIKDCYRVLKTIETCICPKKQSRFVSVIHNLINKYMRLL